ncbi:MAG: peptidylprolyl isomerase [Anaerolineae bacterium]|nr:peptidylprolyl isomerase [Anaerolineae bacterium]
MKRNTLWTLLALAFVLAFGAAGNGSGTVGVTPARAQDDTIHYGELAQTLSPEGFPILGDEDAPITLIEFSNFSCPGCAAYSADVATMLREYVVPGKARFMFVPMIFGFGDDPSFVAAQAALCAADQGKFWEMHDALFAIHNEQGAQSFNLDVVRGAAETLELDVERLAACVGVSEKSSVIDAAIQFAGQVGIQYTPTLTLSTDGLQSVQWFAQPDGSKFDSSVPVDTVAAAVEAAGSGQPVAAWQRPDPFGSAEYTPWRSPDNIIEMEHPSTWTAEANVRGGPLSYFFIQPGVDDTGISLLVLPYRALFDTPPTDTDPKAVLGQLFPDTPAEQIREASAGDLDGAAVTITADGVTRDVWLLPIGGDSGAIIQGITTEAQWPQMEPIVQHAADTLRIDAEAAIAQLDAAFPRPATTIPLPDDAESFEPVNMGEGPCVGVADPTDVTVPADGGSQSWDAPDVVVDAAHVYCAIFTTDKGRVVVELYPQVAPTHVNNLAFLAGQGYYDNITWHRVLTDFVAQSGDPTGTGSGGPGYSIPLETSDLVKYDREGVLGMARSNDPNSAGSQFFITYGPQPALDPGENGPGYTIFGQVVEGMDVLRQITPRDPSAGDTEPGDTLVSVRIVDLGPRE